MLDLAIDDKIFIMNKIDAAVQELDMLFNTENTELIGYPSFGTNFEQFLWQMTPSPYELKRYIDEKIAETVWLSQLSSSVTVSVLEGEYRKIYNVVVKVIDDENDKTAIRVYQLR